MSLRDNTLELIKNAQNGDENSYQELLKIHAPLMESLCYRFHLKKEDKEDVKSLAMIGFIKAIKGFDVSLGYAFSTYAVPLILGEIKRFFRDEKMLSSSRSTDENYRAIMRLNEDISTCSLSEIASKTNLTKEEVLEALEAHYKVSSLDEPLDEESSLTLLDMIGDQDNDYFDLNEALDMLPKKERLIIELRYFKGESQSEVANRLFMNQVAISRLEKKILSTLKEYILHLPRKTR